MINKDSRIDVNPLGGTLCSGTAASGVSITVGSPVYYNATTDRYDLADNSSQAKATHTGVCVVATTAAGGAFKFAPRGSRVLATQLGSPTLSAGQGFIGPASAAGTITNVPTTSGQYVSPVVLKDGAYFQIIGQTPVVIA